MNTFENSQPIHALAGQHKRTIPRMSTLARIGIARTENQSRKPEATNTDRGQPIYSAVGALVN